MPDIQFSSQISTEKPGQWALTSLSLALPTDPQYDQRCDYT